MTIACVLRSGGGTYDLQWVYKLARQCAEHAPGCRFVCLSDTPDLTEHGGPEFVPLEHDWPKWWPKVELFRPGLFGPEELVLYLDLDTLVVGQLNEFAGYDGPLAMLSGFYRPHRRESGVMLFRPTETTMAIYDHFATDPVKLRQRWGADGPFIGATYGRPAVLQELFPHRIVSLKVHAVQSPPAKAVLVCGHGKPRFSDPRAGWAHERWMAA